MSTDPSANQENAAPTEATVSAGKRRRLQQCFERANNLLNRDKPDFDYAHDLYSQCVVNDPGNLVYVESLLDNLQRKFKNNRKGSRLRVFGRRQAFNSAVAEEDWPAIFREGINLLKTNPWDIATLRALAQACAANRYNEVELRYLKNALDAKPKDAKINRHCAHSLARMGQFDMAVACWNRVAETTKSDEPEKMMSELTLAKTMGAPVSLEAMGITGPRPTAPPASWTDAEQPGISEDDSAASAEDDKTRETEKPRHEIKLNVRQQLERAIGEEPSTAENYLKLAELHTTERRFQDAEKVLTRAIEAVGTSLQLQTAMEEARIGSARARVSIAEKRAAREKTDEPDELVAKLRDELNRLELSVYQTRCQRFPENKRIHYDLGLRLRRAGNYLEAIKSYDEARHDPQCVVAATLEMGECWQQLKQYSKALKCYQVAIEKSSELDGDRRKMALYRGAVLAAAAKKTAAARQWFSDLLAIDPHFKDAATRLDKLSPIGEDG